MPTERVEVRVPPDTVIWQVNCIPCGASYGVLAADEPDKRPRFCAYCAARALVTKASRSG